MNNTNLSRFLSLIIAAVLLFSAIVPVQAIGSSPETPFEQDTVSTGTEIISHDAFSVLSPTSDGDYYVNQEIEIQIAVKKYDPPEDSSDPQSDPCNVVKVEVCGIGMWFYIHEDDVGKTLSRSFTYSFEGEYTVRVGYSKSFEPEITDENFVGSYTINIKPTAAYNKYFKIMNPVPLGEYPVNEELEIKIDIQRCDARYRWGIQMNNTIVLDITKDGQIVKEMNIQYKSRVGIKTLNGFIPTEPGEYSLSARHYDGAGGGGGDFGSFTFIVKSEAEVILGDADGNGDVDTADATIIQRAVTKIAVPYDEEQLMRGDVDGDENLTIVDATFIQRYSTKVNTPYPIGEPIP